VIFKTRQLLFFVGDKHTKTVLNKNVACCNNKSYSIVSIYQKEKAKLEQTKTKLTGYSRGDKYNLELSGFADQIQQNLQKIS